VGGEGWELLPLELSIRCQGPAQRGGGKRMHFHARSVGLLPVMRVVCRPPSGIDWTQGTNLNHKCGKKFFGDRSIIKSPNTTHTQSTSKQSQSLMMPSETGSIAWALFASENHNQGPEICDLTLFQVSGWDRTFSIHVVRALPGHLTQNLQVVCEPCRALQQATSPASHKHGLRCLPHVTR